MAKRGQTKGGGSRRRKGETGEAEAPRQTLEQLDDATLHALFNQHKDNYVAKLALKKRADADLKNAAKIAKAELGKGAVDRIKVAIELESPEGEKRIAEQVQGIMQVARWAGSDAVLGTQFAMDLGGDAKSKPYEDGKRAGVKGERGTPPAHFAPGGDAHNEWLAGHADGQAALVRSKLKPTDPPQGSVPRDQWRKDLQAQNEDAERHIKETAQQLGTARSTAVVDGAEAAH